VGGPVAHHFDAAVPATTGRRSRRVAAVMRSPAAMLTGPLMPLDLEVPISGGRREHPPRLLRARSP